MKINDLTESESVTTEIGEVSGIKPEYLANRRNRYAKKTPMIGHVRFLYEIIPAFTWCNACKKRYSMLPYGKTCPCCCGGETWLQQGNKMNIKQIAAG